MLSDVFFDKLNIPAPDHHLGVGSGSHGEQTGKMLGLLDDLMFEHAPDWVLVYGDTNSTLAATLSAVKLHYPVAHLEAGLRSFNRRMPEEHNRVLTDHASDLLLAPTAQAAEHLEREGLSDRTVVVGDVMTDVLYDEVSELADGHSPIATEFGLENETYSIATIHRAENTDDPQRLQRILESLASVDHKVIILAHPRLLARCRDYGLPLGERNLLVHDPLSYSDLLASVRHARGVITDSGGLQKESFLLRIPCTTVRTETEWVETVQLGWNALVEPGAELVEAASRPAPPPTTATPYGDGKTAQRVVRELQARANS